MAKRSRGSFVIDKPSGFSLQFRDEIDAVIKKLAAAGAQVKEKRL